MMRRMWAATAASVVAGWATAQTPVTAPATATPVPKASKDAAAESGVMILRTAGNVDRKVKLVRTTKLDDGRVVNEVKDVSTGETIYVSSGTATQPAKPATKTLMQDLSSKPTTLVNTKSEPKTVSSGSRPAAEPQIVSNGSSGLPKAKERTNDPLMADTKSKSPAAVAATAPPVMPTVSKDVTKPFTKPETLVPAKPTVVMPAAVPVSLPPASAPVAKPTTPVVATPVTAPTVKTTTAPVVVAPVTTPTPIPAPMPANAVARAGESIRVALPVGYEPTEFRMNNEVAPYAATLRTAMRPSQRVDAATALAEGRFGSQADVKALLAHAAKTDAAGVVRAHCIDCLSKLGYSEADHVAYLRQCIMDNDDAVKTAASNALVKLQPKK